MNTAHPNPYEDLGRVMKAPALRIMLERHQIDTDDAARKGVEQWKMLAKAANVHPPSKVTCAMVIGAMRTAQTEDAFAGF